MKINLINYSFLILIILLLLKLIQNLYFEKKFLLLNEKFENDNTYKLINIDQKDRGDEFNDDFNINPNLTGSHINTPMEIENRKII